VLDLTTLATRIGAVQAPGAEGRSIGTAARVRERLAELRERWGFGAVTVDEADLPSLRPVFASLGS
jgi:hypothetical protein